MPTTSSSNTNAANNSHSTIPSGSVVDKIKMLRGFVSNDVFSETDLSNCLRQANYNVELAAERLIMGEFQPTSSSKRQKTTTTTRMPAVILTQHDHHHPNGSSSSSTHYRPNNDTPTTNATRTKSTPVTPNLPLSSEPATTSHRRHDVTPQAAVRAARPPRRHPHVSPIVDVDNDKDNETASSASWLLCHRWISDGVCLQRNGCVAYQEALKVEVLSSNTDSNNNNHNHKKNNNNNHNHTKIPSVRFRGSRIIGQFPRHLHAILGPLLEVDNLIHIKAQALMEDRFLPTGVDVAFAVWYVMSRHITSLLGLLLAWSHTSGN
jgi:hypothetical protein